MRTIHIALFLLLGAVIGFTIFGLMVRGAVTSERAEAQEALVRFEEIREAFASQEPMLELDAAGEVKRRSLESDEEPAAIDQLRVLAYKVDRRRLTEADVPFWFFKLKGPALAFALRGSGFDIKKLGVTAGDLERHGPGLILDETTAKGDRLLVWTE